jgi:hypothetical protein
MKLWLQQHRRSVGSRPMRVVTTGNHGAPFLPGSHTPDKKELERQHQIAPAQARWLDLSSNAKRIFLANSSEYIEFDQPDTLVRVIREVYDESK